MIETVPIMPVVNIGGLRSINAIKTLLGALALVDDLRMTNMLSGMSVSSTQSSRPSDGLDFQTAIARHEPGRHINMMHYVS
jgi:hypothetical protein